MMCGIGFGGIGGCFTPDLFNSSIRLVAFDGSNLSARLLPAGGFGVAFSHAKYRTYRLSWSPSRLENLPSHPSTC